MAKIRLATILQDQPVDIGDDNEEKINIKDSAGLKSGSYSKKHIQNLARAAKITGISPSQLIALSLQESGIGTAKPKATSTGRVSYRNKNTANFLGQISDFEPAQQAELDKLKASTGVDEAYLKPAIVLRDKLKYAKQLGFNDPALALQAYNGYGKLLPKKDAEGKVIPTKYYGIDVPESGLNMRENPLYGKRVLSLQKDIDTNPDIQNIIKTL